MKGKVDIRLLFLYAGLILFAGYFIPKEHNWAPSFSSRHDWPFGTRILYEQLDELFPGVKLRESDASFYTLQDSLAAFSGNLIMIQEALDIDSLDLATLLDWIRSGNEALISATSFPDPLLDSFHLNVDYSLLAPEIKLAKLEGRRVRHNFFPEELAADTSYSFFLEQWYFYFTEKDSVQLDGGLAWVKDDTKVNMIRLDVGAGRLYLHTNPYLFTNFHLLRPGGEGYISRIMSLLPDKDVWWDEYYNGEKGQGGMLDVIIARPPLQWATNIAIFGLVLYLLFMSKRKQRIIPELERFTNDSKELVETIGHLYYQSSNNREIAVKKINMLRQSLLVSFGGPVDFQSADLLAKMHHKLNIPYGELKDTMAQVEGLLADSRVSDEELHTLNNRINLILHKIQ